MRSTGSISAASASPSAPSSPIENYLRRIHTEIAELRDGKPYSSIPAMANVDPDNFGIALATADGYVYEIGDTREQFSIQSISKPFTYGLALADRGMEAVDAKVDVEPSGDSFNEMSLAEGTGRPANAMINAGALTATSLVRGSGGVTRFNRILNTYSAFAGRQLTVSERIYRSELKSGHRNHALAYLLRSFDIIESDPTPVIKDYFRQCSVMVNALDLAMMAATLANSGRNPLSGDQVLDIASVERVLSVMATCGMYDDAGAWLSSVGMPAKSGVGGGTIAVLPGQVGLAVYSPPLDAHGSSVRGVATSQRISHDMELHFVRAARTGRSAIRNVYDITAAPSGMRRTDEAAEVLRSHGHRAQVLELNGDLLFAGAETVVRALSTLEDGVEMVVLDLRSVDEVSDVALRLFAESADMLAATGRGLVLVDSEGTVSNDLTGRGREVPSFATRNAAVEYCESQLISAYGSELVLPDTMEPIDSPALNQLEPEDAQAVQDLMEERVYDDGDVVRRVGQRFGGVFFIVSGLIATSMPAPDGSRIKLTTLGPGMTFGEMALSSDKRQETTVKAAGQVRLKVLTAEAMEQLEEEDPRLAVELWKALTRDAYTRVEQYIRESALRAMD
ncbi:glutaminase A [Arthrobacter sp. zg-ZUI100]|uniref:Glutaminase n=1 Tax=Arthrobacter jiangjiafuii TaxID=2817475 RepID=A0A975R124_9MICC|nr:glutaminase A [Arthrobacter jiangjiafuii]MBP3037351.1 glutaminase A [Arthrobacter jiangjiafuii]MBP3043795.1 glutaminase A [Arthrobacter jiangjiafuii]QWC10817.1 glutaminase A [Arthrobacter jiangjiafuii]